MPQGTITANETSDSFSIPKGPIKITFGGTFGGATITLQESLDSTFVQMLDEAVAIAYSAPNSFSYNVHSGDVLRWVVTGASGTTSIPWSLTYN